MRERRGDNGKKIKSVLISAVCLWLSLVAVTGILFPRFQKKQPPADNTPPIAVESGVQEHILCIDDNQEALLRRLQMIQSAKKELVLSTYYLTDDDSGLDVMSALLQKANEGVKVRILVDGFCEFLDLRSSDVFHTLAQAENVEARVYNPVNLLCPWNTNYRMHDKYLIADGCAYILGGRNTKNVSLGEYPGSHDIDRDILVWNPDGMGSAAQLTQYFEMIWEHPRSKPVRSWKNPAAGALQTLASRYAELNTRYPDCFAPAAYEEFTVPVDGITLLSNPVNVGTKEPVLWTNLMTWLQEGEDILVQTPYIICNRTMYRDLFALTQENRQVRIMTNSPILGANPCGCADYLNQRRNLRRTGAEIWEYAGGNSSHTKTVIIDNDISIVGSFNFDMRSTYLDTELMLVIKSQELNTHLRDMYSGYLKASRCMQLGGEKVLGEEYLQPRMPLLQALIYMVLRVLILPIRHLL